MPSRSGEELVLTTRDESASPRPNRESNRHLEALHRLAMGLLSASELATVLRLLLEHVDTLVRPEVAAALLIDSSGHFLREEAILTRDVPTSWPEGRTLMIQLDSAVETSGPAGTAFRELRTVYLKNLWPDWRAMAWPEAVGLKAGTGMAAVPLTFAGRSLGVLLVYFSPGRKIAPAILNRLEQIASTASPAVHSTLQDHHLMQKPPLPLESDRRRATETSALVEIARAAGSTLDLSEVLNRVVHKTAQLMAADLCSLWLLSEDNQLLLPSAMFGQDEAFISRWKGQAIPLDREPLSMEVVNTGKPVVVLDAETDGRTDKKAVKFFGDKSILVVPLVAKGRILGTLFLNHTRSQHWYSDQDIEIASAIASQAAAAIDNARLYEETRRWTVQLEALQSLVAKLNTNNTVSGIATTIAEETKKIIDYDSCRIFLLRPGTDELIPVTYGGEPEEYHNETPEKLHIRVGEGLTGWVAQTGRPQLVNDTERDPRSRHIPGTPYADESMIACPLSYQDRVTGVITLSKLGLRRFSASDLRLLNILANQAAIAIENARLYQETLQKSQQLRASFRRTGEALAASPNLEETTQLILDLAAGVVQADVCVLQIVDEGCQVQYQAGRGVGWKMAAEVLAHHGEDLVGSVLREGVVIHISDMLTDSRATSLPSTLPEVWRTYLGVPLLLAGKPTGTLSVFRRRAQPFLPSDVELISSFASHAAIAVDRSKLFSALQERLDEFSGLHELSKVISSVNSWEDTLSQLVERIALLVDAERCVILLHEEESETLVAQVPAFGLASEYVRSLRVPLDQDKPVVQVWRTGQTFIKNKLEQFTDVSPAGSAATESSLLMVPMRVGDRSIGVISVSNKSDGRFTENDAKLLTILASQAAAILENAALYRRVSTEKDQLDAIFQNTSDAILIIGEDRRVQRVNPAASLLTNWSQTEAVGQPCRNLYQPRDAEQRSLCEPLTCPLENIKQTRQPIPYLETIATTKSGQQTDVAASYSFFVADGSLYAIAILRDISKVKEVDRLKSEFVSMVSHEFRSPLALIKGYASTLLRPDLTIEPGRQQRFLQGINEAVDRLTRLVDNILNASRIEAGRLKPNHRLVDLADTVTKTVLTLQGTSSKHQLVVNLNETDLRMRTDKDQIEQVLVNLLNNAIKYSPEGGIIEIAVRREPLLTAGGPVGENLLISVTDQGIGIPEPLLDRIFEKFYRVDDPRSKTTPGTGLGLYVCRSIVEAHGGSIVVQSAEGAGTRVSVSLPIEAGSTEPTS